MTLLRQLPPRDSDVAAGQSNEFGDSEQDCSEGGRTMTIGTRVGMRFAVDEETAIYMQQTSFLLGPDKSLNELLFRRLPTVAEKRVAATASTACEQLQGHPRDLMSSEEWDRLYALGSSLGLSRRECREIGHYFGWKIKLAPPGRTRVLAFGCSGGKECLAIKAIFPSASITALDMNLSMPESWAGPLGVESSHRESLEEYARAHHGTFDLVFSNHTLEHLADPERAIGLLRSVLVSGGFLVSAIPIEWHDGSLARAAVERMEVAQHIHPLDCGDLHLGHLWKSSPRDVCDTLDRAGFTSIRLAQCADYPTTWQEARPMRVEHLERRAALGRLLNAVTLVPLKSSLRRVFPKRLPVFVARNYFRLEARLWFSSMRMHYATVRELAFAGMNP